MVTLVSDVLVEMLILPRIYKPKYMEDPVPSKAAHAPAKVTKPPPSPNGEGTARPRGKSIFGRKKAPVAT